MLPVMLSSFCMMALSNMDVILIKRFFDPVTAGYYTALLPWGKFFSLAPVRYQWLCFQKFLLYMQQNFPCVARSKSFCLFRPR